MMPLGRMTLNVNVQNFEGMLKDIDSNLSLLQPISSWTTKQLKMK